MQGCGQDKGVEESDRTLAMVKTLAPGEKCRMRVFTHSALLGLLGVGAEPVR